MTIQVELQIRVIRRKGEDRSRGSRRRMPREAASCRGWTPRSQRRGSPRRARRHAAGIAVPAGHQPRLARPPIVEIEALARAAPPPRPAVTLMNISFASTGRSSRSAPGRLGEPRRGRRWRRGRCAARRRPRASPGSARRDSGPWTADGRRACGGSGSPRRAPDRRRSGASAESPPFLTKPKESASTPARQVRSAGAQPRLRHRIGEAGAVDVEAEARAPWQSAPSAAVSSGV